MTCQLQKTDVLCSLPLSDACEMCVMGGERP